MSYFIKALQIMAIVSAWSVRALEDNKVTLEEANTLVRQLCQILGVSPEVPLGTELED